MVAGVVDRPRGSMRRTLARDKLARLDAVASITDRVWRLRKDSVRTDNPMISLGQSGENDIVLPEYTVSTHHCAFGFDATGMLICDSGSLNGTKLNGKTIEPGVQVRLRDRVRVVLGRLELQFLQAPSFFNVVKRHAPGS
jgi:pSer/pThr/pTyr-binding forkhead associated (FHA) protein